MWQFKEILFISATDIGNHHEKCPAWCGRISGCWGRSSIAVETCSGTTHVKISASHDGDLNEWYFAYTGDTESAYVTFGPGESGEPVGIYAYPDSVPNVGHLSLTIYSVDGVDALGRQ